jgi:hypothetical protein
VAASLPKPKITATDYERWVVDFRNGAIGEVWIDEGDRSALPIRRHRWVVRTVEGEPWSAWGVSNGRDLAMRAMWCRAASLSPPPRIEITSEDGTAEAIAYRAERSDSGSGCAEILRDLLHRRTGFRWSVRIGRGTSRSILTIGPVGARAVNDAMSAHDAALLASIVREEFINPQGYSIGRRPGDRSRTALAIIGLTTDELAAADWPTIRAQIQLATAEQATIH